MMTRSTRIVGLSRRDYTHKAPLSQVGGKPLIRQSNTKEQATRGEDYEHSRKREVATDDEPESSSEEGSQYENSRGQEENKTDEGQRDIRLQASTRTGSAAKRKRKEEGNPLPSASATASTDDDDRLSSWQSSQTRTTKRTYNNKFKGSQSHQQHSGGFRHVPLRDEAKEDHQSFRIPPTMSFEESRGAQKRTKVKTSSIENDEESVGFRQPATFREDILESPPKKFINPPGHSAISVPSSALTIGELDFDFDDDLSSLSSPPSDLVSPSEDDEEDENVKIQKQPEQSLCPNCNAPVDPDLLSEYLIKPNRRLRDDRVFCESHKMFKAEKEWENNKYPAIDWAKFDSRVQKHLAEFERLLIPNPAGFFRGRFESTMKEGQAKVFKLSIKEDGGERLSCGYYGPKGASKMFVPHIFSDCFACHLFSSG